MTTVKEKLAAILRTGFLPILVDDALDPLLLAGICREAGIPAIEYSLWNALGFQNLAFSEEG